ncbi:phosphatidate cytidylyltransferase, partial [Chloroflexota bacterium]
MMKKRVITALVGIPLVVLLVWFDTPLPWFSLFIAAWGALAVYEFYRITGIVRMLPLIILGITGTLLFILSPHCPYPDLMPQLLTAIMVISLLLLLLPSPRERAFANWAWTIAGILYVGWLLSYLVVLRLEAGRSWLLLALFITFASDSGAFFMGRAFGRHHLAPAISPHKTWEGAVGGILGSVIMALLFTLPSPLQLPLSINHAVLLGLLASVFGQLGDLV